jgi:hypothetical protein
LAEDVIASPPSGEPEGVDLDVLLVEDRSRMPSLRSGVSHRADFAAATGL